MYAVYIIIYIYTYVYIHYIKISNNYTLYMNKQIGSNSYMHDFTHIQT